MFIDKFNCSHQKSNYKFQVKNTKYWVSSCIKFLHFSTPAGGSLWTILCDFSMAYTTPRCFCFPFSSSQETTYSFSIFKKLERRQNRWNGIRIVYEMKCSKINAWQGRAIYAIYWVSKLKIKCYLSPSPQNALSPKCQQIYSCQVFSSQFKLHHGAKDILRVTLSNVMPFTSYFHLSYFICELMAWDNRKHGI